MRERTAIISVIACLAVTAPLPAQYELGVGNALDANPAVGAGGYNPRAAVPDFRARNLVVTGNVAGGRGFRGTVGYGAEFDFAGVLGSNDLFQERAFSAYSSPSFFTAARTFERLRFGQHLGEIEFRRAGRAASPRDLNEQRFVPDNAIDDRLALDHFAISSTTSAMYEGRGEGQIVGILRGPEGRQFAASASSVLGVTLTPMQQMGQLIGLSSYDMVRTAEDAVAGRASGRVGEPFQFAFADLERSAEPAGAGIVPGRVESEPMSTRVDPQRPAPYRDVLEGIARRQEAITSEPGEDLLAGLDRRFEELKRQLAEMTPEVVRQPGADEAPPAIPGTSPLTREQLEELAGTLRHGVRLERLAIDERNLGRFQQLLAEGEQMLRDGEYFWAERRFDHALRFMPGHPLAGAGLGHAQLGAGLFVPAGLTLRRLLTEHPEMIDVQYGPDLLPSRARLNLALAQLREQLALNRDRVHRAFVLAYMGHQLERRELIEEGLGVLRQESPDDALLPLLEEIWLAD